MYQHDPAHSGRTPATVFNDGPLYLQWAYAFGERVEVEAQPVISGSVIYQGVMNGEMHAIDATREPRSGSPALAGLFHTPPLSMAIASTLALLTATCMPSRPWMEAQTGNFLPLDR